MENTDLKTMILHDVGLLREIEKGKAATTRAHAANRLQGTITKYAAQSHLIAMPTGDTHFLFAKIRDIAQFGEKRPESTEKTQLACAYIIDIMITAYELDESARRQLYAAALIYLAKNYSLQPHNFEMPGAIKIE